MLKTPFGTIRILVDGQPVGYEAAPHIFDKPMTRERPLAGCYRIRVSGEGEVCCVLEGCAVKGMDSSGEGYQAVEFTHGEAQLTIGAETDREDRIVTPNPGGITVELHGDDRQVVFGIAWTEDYAGAADVRTWFAADPTLD